MAMAKPSNSIGPWRLGETLGFGSTGRVHLAQHERTGHKTAVKVISKTIFNTGDDGAGPFALPCNIEREIVVMKLLSHPNVLSLYDVWETNNNLYLILEYAEKGELFNLMVDRGPLPEREAVKCFRQIVIAISYCHALGIVHRDLKPENLLLDSDYNIKIADFGMAALQTDAALLETSCGSPHYAAPEIVSGLPYRGFASDVWSCGVILFALLTGRLPFDEDNGNVRDLLLKVQRGQFEMPDDTEISKDAQNLIGKILVVDPTQRMKTRDILTHPLLKKHQTIKDSQSIRNLPRENTYLYPLADVNNHTNATIDDSILQNLVVLWHGTPADEIVANLKANGTNTEKTLYALLYRFKQEANKRSRHKIKKTKNKTRNALLSTSSPSSHNRLSESTPRRRTAKRRSVNFSSSKKRSSFILASNSNNGSPIPSRSSKRTPFLNTASGNVPPMPVKLLNSYKRNSKRSSKRLSYMPNVKRGSLTSNSLSKYTGLIDEDDWEYIEKDTKRTSSDFATLIDEIFEPEKFELARKEKAEFQRKVQEAKRHKLYIAKTDQENGVVTGEFDGMGVLKKINNKVSSPLMNYEYSQQELLQDINTLLTNRCQLSAYTRPISKLDPGLMPVPETMPYDIKEKTDLLLDTEMKILETIRKSKILGPSSNLRKEVPQDRDRLPPVEESPIVSTTPLMYNNDPKEVCKISDIQVPHFTRKSKFFTNTNNRRSVLSLYSSRHSFKGLSQLLDSEDPSTNPYSHNSGPVGEEIDLTEDIANMKNIDNNINNKNNNNRLYDVSESAILLPGNNDNNNDDDDVVADDDDNYDYDNDNDNDSQSIQSSMSNNTEPTTFVKLPSLNSFQRKNASGLGIYQREPSNKSLPEVATNVEDIDEDGENEKGKEIQYENVTTSISNSNIKKNVNTKDTVRESSNVSFLKKFSKGKILELEIHVKIPAERLFEGLHKLLEGWKQYGLKNLRFDTPNMIITGKLVNDNILSLRSTLFEIIVLPNGDDRSLIKFNKKTGSTKTLKKLGYEIQIVLQKEGVLDS
ncbi:serine/threonine protein kinase [Saccharomyces pastorianus]|uniref:non-specific serine/threonine protein kinase n=1 Tax=Saccharomyces pastorianus TaxID=27292 RepID=A0A6C1E3G3_SACPS|nr:serine/threonine protein kinase [Saccharomyces pastorianus]